MSADAMKRFCCALTLDLADPDLLVPAFEVELPLPAAVFPLFAFD